MVQREGAGRLYKTLRSNFDHVTLSALAEVLDLV